MVTSLFTEKDDGLIIPGEYARGGWSDEFLDGGAVGVLIAHLALRARADPERQLARLTIDLLAPVPMSPLRPVQQRVQEGQRIELLDTSLLTTEGTLVCRSSALFISAADSPPFPMPPTVLQLSPLWGDSAPLPYRRQSPMFQGAMETRVGRPLTDELPGAWWARLTVPAFPDVPSSPAIVAAALADRASAVTGASPDASAAAINAESRCTWADSPRVSGFASRGSPESRGEARGSASRTSEMKTGCSAQSSSRNCRRDSEVTGKPGRELIEAFSFRGVTGRPMRQILAPARACLSSVIWGEMPLDRLCGCRRRRGA